MKFSDYISAHHVFTTAQLMGAMDSPQAGREQLRRAVRAGAVERARRSLLVSNFGRFEGAPLDPGELVSVLDPEAVLSYHTALEALGVAHDVGFVCRFRSDAVRSPFVCRGVDYEPCGPVGCTRWKDMRAPWGLRRVAAREQTVLDCMRRTSLSGGAEEAVRSLTALAWVDVGELAGMARAEGPAASSRAGWLLEQKKDDWHVGDDALACLETALGPGPYRLGHAGAPGRHGWSARWRLVLPDSSEEVSTWITRS